MVVVHVQGDAGVALATVREQAAGRDHLRVLVGVAVHAPVDHDLASLQRSPVGQRGLAEDEVAQQCAEPGFGLRAGQVQVGQVVQGTWPRASASSIAVNAEPSPGAALATPVAK